MELLDTHVHLDQPEFDADRAAVIDRACASGVASMLCVGISAASSAAAVQLAQAHDAIHAAVGIQPNYCVEARPGDWQQVIDLAARSRVAAIGETGLDRYWDYTPIELQRDYFARHLELAAARSLPVVIHCRDAADDVLAMLRDAAARGPLSGVLHSFSGDAAMAAECLELGLYISFSGAVTYTNKKFAPLHEAARTVPSDRLLIETDSPYLVPQPLRGKAPRNEPANILHTARRLAELRGVSIDDLAAQTTANARRLLRI